MYNSQIYKNLADEVPGGVTAMIHSGRSFIAIITNQRCTMHEGGR